MSQSANVFTLFRSLLMAMTTEVHSTYTCRGVKAGGQLLPVSPLMLWEQVSSICHIQEDRSTSVQCFSQPEMPRISVMSVIAAMTAVRKTDMIAPLCKSETLW